MAWRQDVQCTVHEYTHCGATLVMVLQRNINVYKKVGTCSDPSDLLIKWKAKVSLHLSVSWDGKSGVKAENSDPTSKEKKVF